LPFLLIYSFKQKYAKSIPARFFLQNNPKFETENGIWFHSCSLGETKSLKPIIDKLNTEVNITTTTQTGFEEAKKLTPFARYLPYEMFLPFWVNKQKVLVVTEAELWFMLFFIAKLKATKTILINARISDNSYKNYKKFAFFYKQIFKYIDTTFAQTNIDKTRLEELGAKNVQVVGNIKAYQNINLTKAYEKPSQKTIILASTHKKEEELILNNLKISKDETLLIVPRHPERFKEIDQLLLHFSNQHNLSYHKFSDNQNLTSNIVLVDTMGELINLYAISDLVILGGSFVENVGGHNPLEPAFFNKPIISGKHYFNQKSLYPLVDNIILCQANEISQHTNQAKPTKINSIPNLEEIINEIRKSI
jgi:3-deoxy-D-manno-octulosonic-acid transferase